MTQKKLDVLRIHGKNNSNCRIAVDYVRTGEVDELWTSEEQGRAGKAPESVIERGFGFIAWVARNKLSAGQARLIWRGDGAHKPGGSAGEAEQVLGEFLSGR